MTHPFSENKKSILLDLIKQLDNELSQFLHNIEQDYDIPEDSWKAIDNASGLLFRLINELEEEINFS